MEEMIPQNSPTENRILAALSAGEEEYRNLSPHFEIVDLPTAKNIHNSGDTLPYVYFPLDAIIYQFITMKNGATVEAGIISNEGFLGMSSLMGVELTCHQAVSLMPKRAVRIRAEILKREFNKGGLLQNLALRFIHSLYAQISQTAACNRIHLVEARLCRWLLMTHDRIKSDDLPVTQEFIAQMLGIHRPCLTIAVGILQKKGLVCCTRGNIKILDRQSLENLSCECYGVIQEEFSNSAESGFQHTACFQATN